MIRTIGLVLKPGAPEAIEAMHTAMALAPDARFVVERSGHHALREVPARVASIEAGAFEDEAHLVLVLGGDGTLIHAASLLQNKIVPILGVNLGRIGFLTEVTRGELASVLPCALAGTLGHSDRMRLDAEVWRGDELVLRGRILNDAALSQLALARIAAYRVELGEELVTIIRGDGVIISTPTGSTAYSMAAGGAILEPNLEAVAVTPICPHALTQRALVVPPARDIRVALSPITLCSRRSTDALVTSSGAATRSRCGVRPCPLGCSPCRAAATSRRCAPSLAGAKARRRSVLTTRWLAPLGVADCELLVVDLRSLLGR